MRKIVLAADLGGTNLRLAGVKNDGEIVFREKIATPRGSDGYSIVNAFASVIESEALADFEIEAISLAVPATVDSETGDIANAPNVHELIGFPMGSVMREKFGVDVVLENDANAAVLGEVWLGAAKGFRHTIMVTLGTGVGGGLIIDGNLLHGAHGGAGEIGHIAVEQDGVECGCGSRGCIEQYASATAVVRMAKEFGLKEDGSKFGSEFVYKKALEGNDAALKAFERQGYYLGVFLGGMLNIFDPEIVVIGGGAADGWNLFIEPLKTEMKYRAYPEHYKRVKLVRASLGDNAGILGAARLGFDIIQKQIEERV
ncbi:MAG: ROK family protein [Pyrinomonadaceae bacterium]